MKETKDLQPIDLTHVHLLRPHPAMNDYDTMVGVDNRLDQIMDKLIGQKADLQIIPITGMGGIVSQVYDIKEMLLELLRKIHEDLAKREENSEYHHLGLKLFQHLSGRTYLIVIDDLWNIEAWDKLQSFFPNSKGSRIIVTTRLKDVANYVGSNNIHKINPLDKKKSWTLLCRTTFGQEGCPYPELEEVGKRIAKNCQGLPLSISVIGGVLVKSQLTREFWEFVANNMDKITSSEDSGCLDILLLSYRHLPTYLKPCFLYMGVYPEDHNIRISELIKLWVTEGFLKPNKFKTLEEVAEEYLKDLTKKHLIIVNSWGSLGKLKTCGIHDLLRDLCLREAQKEKFFLVKETCLLNLSQIISGQRCVVIQQNPSHVRSYNSLPYVLQSTSLVRSLTYAFRQPLKLSQLPNFSLLRVYKLFKHNYYDDEEVDINLVNIRYLHLSGNIPKIVSLTYQLWNLQTLVIDILGINKRLTPQIWRMPHLRHLIGSKILLPDPRSGMIDIVLKNLQTLMTVVSFRCTEDVLEKIPNVKKLKIGHNYRSREGVSHYCLNNIGRLQKLQSLIWELPFHMTYKEGVSFQNFVFPSSLKKLSLDGSNHYKLEDIIATIGLLPQLEKLKLESFLSEEEWNPIEGHFLCLRALQIEGFIHLVYWTAESIHFPVLEHLDLSDVDMLEEIPSGIGDITTLQSIKLYYCSDSVVASAKNILEEQLDSGNEGFRLRIWG